MLIFFLQNPPQGCSVVHRFTMEAPRLEIMVVPATTTRIPELPPPKFESPVERMKRIRWRHPWATVFDNECNCWVIERSEFRSRDGFRGKYDPWADCEELAPLPVGRAIWVYDRPTAINETTDDEKCAFMLMYPLAYAASIASCVAWPFYQAVAVIALMLNTLLNGVCVVGRCAYRTVGWLAETVWRGILRVWWCLFTRREAGATAGAAAGTITSLGKTACAWCMFTRRPSSDPPADIECPSNDKLSTTSSGKFSCSSSKM